MNEKETTVPDSLGEQLRGIKRDLRALMNGVASASMRQKGLAYKVIFGVELPRLQALAEGLPHTPALARALWNENIRECRLLAPMVQPVETFLPVDAEEWVATMHYPEEAEVCSLHLFARLPFASDLAFRWMARDEEMVRLCGFTLVARLLTLGARPGERDQAELLDQAEAALRGDTPAVQRAAGKALVKYMDLGPDEEARGEALLASLEG